MPGISKHVFAALIRSRRLGASIAAAAILAALLALQPAAGLASTTNPWLDRPNLWRTSTGVGPLTENTLYSSGDYNHSVYMVKNDLVTHYETPGVPYYTTAGDTAARNSNIEVNSSTAFTDTQAIDWWMAAPFHSMGMMDPRLTQTGFGAYREAKSGWAAGFSLDTIHGNSFTGGSYPVYFPGNGTTEPLTNYSGNEFPDPLSACPNASARRRQTASPNTKPCGSLYSEPQPSNPTSRWTTKTRLSSRRFAPKQCKIKRSKTEDTWIWELKAR